MNREIKFQAWVKPDNGLQKYSGIYPVLALSRTHVQLERSSAFAEQLFPLETVELMQFTGFCDCEGNEIYEGHLMEQYRGGTPLLVRWSPEDGKWALRGTYDAMLAGFGPNSRIIGNVFENPELNPMLANPTPKPLGT